MNMFRAFMELDKLYEDVFTETSGQNHRWRFVGKAEFFNRASQSIDIIAIGTPIEVNGKSKSQALNNARFVIRKNNALPEDTRLSLFDYTLDIIEKEPEARVTEVCPKCNKAQLNDMGTCPVCDEGEEDLDESKELSTEHAVTSVVDQIKDVYEAGLFSKLPVGRDNAFTLEISGPDKSRLAGYFARQPEFNHEINNASNIISHEFISDKYDIEIFDSFIQMYKIPQNESLEESTFADLFSTPKMSNWVTMTSNSTTTTPPQVPSTTQSVSTNPINKASSSGKHVVTIVYDDKAHKLRAHADDGTHGEANVAFPNNLRNREGQQYEVDNLIWNGKNYRVSGNIKPI